MFFKLFTLSVAILLNGDKATAQNTGSPCASVSSLSAEWISKHPEATAALVPAQTAEDCLKSVPIDVEEDQALLEELVLYLSWQPNLAFLSNPPEGQPEGYNEERVDILKAIMTIQDNLGNGKYENEFTFQVDLFMAMTKTYDPHAIWHPDIMNLFVFTREVALVSVSPDGKELPVLYDYYDILTASAEWKPSPITEINNQTAEEFVLKWAEQFSLHEDHARYNFLFPNQAIESMNRWTNRFDLSVLPLGPYTTVKHENGSAFQYSNGAVIRLGLMDDIEDGKVLFVRHCNQGGPQSSTQKRSIDSQMRLPTYMNNRAPNYCDVLLESRAVPSKPRQQIDSPTATGYPAAETIHSQKIVRGYFINGKGYDDVAVLSVPSFWPESDEGYTEFQDLIGGFLKHAKSAGKKRLLIDLRGNGGGSVSLGYDLFVQLFPSITPYGASRFHAHEAFDLVGQLITEELRNVSYEDIEKNSEQNSSASNLDILWRSVFNYGVHLDINNENFASWRDYFGPHTFNGDNFSTPARWNIEDPASSAITGYGLRSDKLDKAQPFETDNIVILQDGSCGSTCAIFSEFAKTQARVQQIAVGGKPQTGPMQGVAGSKGAEVITLADVYNQVTAAFETITMHQEELNSTDFGKIFWARRPVMRTAYRDDGLALSFINLRDNIRMNDTNEIPLEFVYEAADCRIFYTADMIRDPTALWKRSVDARWGDPEKVCVEGSTKDKSSLSGGSPTSNNDRGNGDKKKGSGTHTRVNHLLVVASVAVVGMIVLF